MIHELIVSTCNPDGSTHLAPMGIQYQPPEIILAPYHPSTTLENLRRNGQAVLNLCDDVRIFAGCLSGRKTWPMQAARHVPAQRLRDALGHIEVQVQRVEADPQRPRFFCTELCRAQHASFRGFNRAQAAVIEAAILCSRLHLLEPERIRHELDYLRNAVEKTAGERERQAWEWLEQRIEQFYQGANGATS